MGGRKLATGLCLAGLVVAVPALAATAPTTRVSVATGGGQANGHSIAPAISGDGRIVAFYSDATNLVAGDANNVRDVFVHDRQTGTTTRVSVGTAGEANGHSFAPALSADGRFVAFHSHASNLVAGDTNGVDDVFVHDRADGRTARITAGDAGSYSPALSADGRFVAFSSDASNLVANDRNAVRDVFVHDRATGATTRVSVAADGTEANVGSDSAAISGDGLYVAFSSFAPTLVPDDTNDAADVFVHDRQTRMTTRVNMYDAETEADGDSYEPALSGDGRYVAFESDAWNLVWGDTNFAFDVFVHDRASRGVRRVSVDDAGTEAMGPSRRPAISADGRFIAFQSEATGLVAGDTNGAWDVIVHDRLSGATTRASVGENGVQGNEDSLRPAISADGRYVAFDSDSTELVRGDSNRFTDVFVRDLAAGPLPPPPPAPPAQCRVPHVIGLRLATARARIRAGRCAVGRVRRARVRTRRRAGRVLSQSPRAGTRSRVGTRVHLIVGRR